jgi:methionine-rich copper-binding protein CopC
MRIPAILAAFALTALTPSALLAHVELTASVPAAGTEAKAPKVVMLTFSMPVDQATAAASIVMTAMPGMANHGEMPIRNFTTSWSDEGRTMTLTLKKALPIGTYEVRWQAAASDGHPMSGTVMFDVK